MCSVSHLLLKLLQQPVERGAASPSLLHRAATTNLDLVCICSSALSSRSFLLAAEICQAPHKSPLLVSRGQVWVRRGVEQAGSLPRATSPSLRMGINSQPHSSPVLLQMLWLRVLA